MLLLVSVVSFYFWVVFYLANILVLVHLPVDGYLGCFHFGAIITKAAVIICISFLWTYLLISLR